LAIPLFSTIVISLQLISCCCNRNIVNGPIIPSFSLASVDEHKELHEQLYKGIKEGGKVGEAAKAVADILHPHFEKEEEYALPTLGLLSSLLSEEQEEGQSKITQDIKNNVTIMRDKLKSDLPHMIEEHNKIVATLNNLIKIAKIENKTELVQFAENSNYMPKLRNRFYILPQY
jgi:hypothetical protein